MPFLPLLGAAVGLGQAIVGGIKAKKYQKQLEKLPTPSYGGSESIMDYYNKALSRYNTSPYQSEQYKYAVDNAKQSTAASIGAMQDRRSALGSIGQITAAQNDATTRAGISAENQRQQNFGALGAATNMKAGDERMQFQQNKIAPFEKKYNLLSMRAGAANQTANAGLNNIFSAAGAYDDYKMIDKIYGKESK